MTIEKQLDEVFYFVFNPRQGKPKLRHKTESEAELEALRLAKENPGEKYFVLKPVISFKSKKPVDPLITKKFYG